MRRPATLSNPPSPLSLSAAEEPLLPSPSPFLLPSSPSISAEPLLPPPAAGTSPVSPESAKPPPPPAAFQSPAVGVVLALVACAGFGGAQLAVRAGTSRLGLTVPLFAVARGVVTFTAAAGFIATAQPARPARNDVVRVIGRGLIGATAMVFKYEAVSRLPLQEATAIIFTSPAWTLLASHFLLREPARRVELLSCAACLAAVAAIATAPDALDGGKETAALRPLGVAFALGGALLQCAAYIVTRWLGGRVHAQYNVLSLGATSLALGLGLLNVGLAAEVAAAATSPRRMAVLAAAGACSYAGASSVNRALQLLSAGTVSVLRSLDIPISYVLAAVVLGERVAAPQSIVGSLVILVASSVLGYSRARRS
jgi:drug/metabolite transporter (DMT)-like permease